MRNENVYYLIFVLLLDTSNILQFISLLLDEQAPQPLQSLQPCHLHTWGLARVGLAGHRGWQWHSRGLAG